MSFFAELKRRNVIRVSIAYAVVAWLLVEVSSVVLPTFEAPGWILKVVTFLIIMGLPIAILLAWAFEMTPEGIKREHEVDRSKSITHNTGRKLDFMIIGVLAAALAYFAYDKFMLPNADITGTEVVVADAAPDAAIDKSIAVLPFVNMSSDTEQEFFSDGLSEELLNLLAQLPGLRVAARTSSFQFKGKSQDIGKIAQILNVAHVLEGSVRKSGDQLRITAQLIKAEDGFHIWSSTYDRELTDVFAIQDEISAAIGEALKIHLSLGPQSSVTLRPSASVIEAANPQAYEAYLHGRQLINRRGRESIEQAVRFLEKAIRLDDNYAPAHAQLAIATALLLNDPSNYGDLTLDEVTRRATPHARKALALAPNLAEAHGALAILAMDQQDYAAVMVHTQRAIELNPVYIDAIIWQVLATQSLGNYVEMRATMQVLLEADPLSVIGRLNYMSILGWDRKIAEAHQMADDLVDLFPWAGYVAHCQIAQFFEGEIALGLGWALRAFAADPTDPFSNYYLAEALNFVGLHDEARRVDKDLAYLADLAQGHFEPAIEKVRAQSAADPENSPLLLSLADTLHRSGQVSMALPFYVRVQSKSPSRPIIDPQSSNEPSLRLALGLQQAGDTGGFERIVRLVMQDLDARTNARAIDQSWHRSKAMLAALEDNSNEVFDAIETAIQLGLRDPGFFLEPGFDELRDLPEFTALQARLAVLLKDEREKILILICHENPVPEAWQPLPETCAAAG